MKYSVLNKINPLRVKRWSIGLWEGDSLENLREIDANPILTVDDITDCTAGFIADPFIFKDDAGSFYIFFEILNINSDKGEIGYAVSRDLRKWQYGGIVISEKFHLSYPFIFQWENEIYMIPESYQDNSIRLYKAKSFPNRWEYCANIIEGAKYTDNTIFRKDGLFWLLTYILDEKKGSDNSRLEIWYSDSLMHSWQQHRLNPISYGKDTPSRPGGRINIDGELQFCLQNTVNYYGQELFRYKINLLNKHEFNFEQIGDKPFFTATGIGWNALGIHSFDVLQVDNNKYAACTDGLSYVTLKNPKILMLKAISKINRLFKKF